ncbi:hypothetical protein D3C71_1826210 [compost metagenome]
MLCTASLPLLWLYWPSLTLAVTVTGVPAGTDDDERLTEVVSGPLGNCSGAHSVRAR